MQNTSGPSSQKHASNPKVASEQNKSVFDTLKRLLPEADSRTYNSLVDKSTVWLSSYRAYYPAAIPEIVTIVKLAQTTLQKSMGFDTRDPNFHVLRCPNDHPMLLSYIRLVQIIRVFHSRFRDPQEHELMGRVINTVVGAPELPLLVPIKKAPDASVPSSSGSQSSQQQTRAILIKDPNYTMHQSSSSLNNALQMNPRLDVPHPVAQTVSYSTLQPNSRPSRPPQILVTRQLSNPTIPPSHQCPATKHTQMYPPNHPSFSPVLQPPLASSRPSPSIPTSHARIPHTASPSNSSGTIKIPPLKRPQEPSSALSIAIPTPSVQKVVTTPSIPAPPAPSPIQPPQSTSVSPSVSSSSVLPKPKAKKKRKSSGLLTGLDFIDVDLEWYRKEQERLAASSQTSTSTPNLIDHSTSSTSVIDTQSSSLSKPTADIPIHTPTPQTTIPTSETSSSVSVGDPGPAQQPFNIQSPQDPSIPPESIQTSSVMSEHISPVPKAPSPTDAPTHPSLDTNIEDSSMAAPSDDMDTDLEPVDAHTTAPLETASTEIMSTLSSPAVQPKAPSPKPDATPISNDMEVEPAPDDVVLPGSDQILQETVNVSETSQPSVVSNDPPTVSGNNVDVTMGDDAHQVLSRHPSPSPRSDDDDMDVDFDPGEPVPRGGLKQLPEPIDDNILSVDASMETVNEPTSVGPTLPPAAIPSTEHDLSVETAKSRHEDTAPGGLPSSSRTPEEGDIEEGEILLRANPSTNNENVRNIVEPGQIVRNVDVRATDKDVNIVKTSDASSVAKPTHEPSGSNGIPPPHSPKVGPSEIRDGRPSTVFGPEMRIIIGQRGTDRPASIDFTYKISSVQFDLISKWNNWTKTTDDVTTALCVSLGAYSSVELQNLVRGKPLHEAKDTLIPFFTTSHQSSWPDNGGLYMTVNYKGTQQPLPLSPPFGITPDHLVDLSQFSVEGENIIHLNQKQDMSSYTFFLFVHHPTPKQLEHVATRRKADEDWNAWLVRASRPFEMPASWFP